MGATLALRHEHQPELLLGCQAAVGKHCPAGRHPVLGRSGTGQQEEQDEQQPRGQRGEVPPRSHGDTAVRCV